MLLLLLVKKLGIKSLLLVHWLGTWAIPSTCWRLLDEVGMGNG